MSMIGKAMWLSRGIVMVSRRDHHDLRGQGTVEAALGIPMMFVILLLLVQPGILLYDRMVMQAAAAEGCRLLATKTDALGDMGDSCEAFIRHRLAAIPPHDCFHVHEGGCTWDIQLEGDEATEIVSVTIGNEVRPLPLLDAGAVLLGIANDRGTIRLETSVALSTQPAWVEEAREGRDPAGWVGSWLI